MTRSLRRTSPLALVVAVALGLAGCSAPAPADPASSAPASAPASTSAPAAPSSVTIEHAQGSTEVATNPAKVVVMDLASLETIKAIGAEATVVGVPDFAFPEHLSSFSGVQKVGTLFEPDYEAIAGLEPDLIVVAARSAATYPEMEKIAPTIDLTADNTAFIESARLRAGQVGEVFGATDKVDALFSEIDAAAAEVKALAPEAGKVLVSLVTGGEVTVFGPGSRFGWLYSDLGLTPVDTDIEAATHGDPVSNEFLLEQNPDWLLVVDRDAAIGTEGAQAAKEVLDNEIVQQTTFWKNGQVAYLDPVALYIVMNGPTSVLTAISQVRDALSGASQS